MYWADEIAQRIIDSGKYKPYWVDDMKTPSGYAHIGSLMGPVIHSIVYRALKKRGLEAEYTFVINDFDTVDGLPEELKESHAQYMGYPLKNVPSPKEGFESMADLYADDYARAIKSLGVEAKILSSWEMYHDGKFDEMIRIALDNAEKIQDIYEKVSGSKKREMGWLPFQVICEKCGKLGTNRVYAWDGEKVSYKCEPEMVKWATGCGHEGKISPFGGTGKLPWKVDWPAHWKVIGVTIEGAGKDHASAGGSYDIAMELCKAVFDYPKPFRLPYEFLLIGGKKMSSSKGLGLKARDLVKILPVSVGRFLFARHNIKKQANFDPNGTMAIPDLFDHYDKAANAFWEGSGEALASMFEYSQVRETPEKHFLPRFSDVARYVQDTKVDVNEKFRKVKGEPLTDLEKETLGERIKYAKIWLADYAPEEEVFMVTEEIPEEAKKLSEAQKEYLRKVNEILSKDWDAEELQTALYNLSKEANIPAKEAFGAIYLVLVGKTHGPKAAWFLMENLEKAKKRFEELTGN